MDKKKNYFKELASISVKDKTEKKGKFSYLSWASAWSLVKTAHPDAQRKVYESEHTGLNFFTDGRTAYVKVGIIIDEIYSKSNCNAWIRLKLMDWRRYHPND